MTENRVKAVRERLGMSQVELSRKSRIAAPNLSDIETGKRLPWAKARRRLARVLGVNEAELFPEVDGHDNGSK